MLLVAESQAAQFEIRVEGNKLVDGNGNVIQLRGVVYGGYDFTAVEGWDPADPSGGQAGQPYGPNLPAIVSWGANVLRLPLNEASWLGLSCYEPNSVSGQPKSADPGNNYQLAVETQVQEANAAGLYVILDLHWSAPNWPNNYWGQGSGTPAICPEGQDQMADNDHALAFWTSVATTFKNNPAVMFELFNEPNMVDLTTGQDPWMTMMQGGSDFTQVPAVTNHSCTSPGVNCPETVTVNETWQGVGYQQMINAVRQTGATNVVLVGTAVFDTDLSEWLADKPTDSLNQMAATWHPYPPEVKANAISQIVSAGTGYAVGDTITFPGNGEVGVYAPAVVTVTSVTANGGVTNVSINAGSDYLYSTVPSNPVAQVATSGQGTGATFDVQWYGIDNLWPEQVNWPTVQQIAAQVPVVITETGAGNVGPIWLQELLPWADGLGISYLGQIWDVWTGPNVLITDGAGAPTPGYGVYFQQHLQSLAANAPCGSTPSGSTVTQQISQTTGSIPATTAQCPYGATQPTTTTVTQVSLCTNGTLTAEGSPVSTTTPTGSPSCNPPPKVNGSCGAAAIIGVTAAPTTGLCSSGSASAVSGTGTFSWSCAGSNGGSTATCSAVMDTNVAATGSTTIPLPSYSAVAGMSVDNTGLPFDWGYMTVGGHVNYVLNVAAAGTYNLTISDADPTGGQILTVAVNGGPPTPITLSGTGSITTYKNVPSVPLTLPAGLVTLTLTAQGQHFNIGGLVLAPISSAACGNHANGSTYTLSVSQSNGSTAATATQCAYGGTQATQTTVNQAYLCTNGVQTAQGSPTSVTVNIGSPTCNAPPKVNGACGPAEGIAVITVPTVGLCTSGTASIVSGALSFSWTCGGSNGGSNAICSAPLATTIATSGSTAIPLPSYSDFAGMSIDDTGLPFDWGYMTVGGNVSYVINIPTAGIYNLTISEADPTGGQVLTVSVNGGVPTPIILTGTGSFTAYQNAGPVPLALPAGLVTITLTAQGQHFNIGGLSLAQK